MHRPFCLGWEDETFTLPTYLRTYVPTLLRIHTHPLSKTEKTRYKIPKIRVKSTSLTLGILDSVVSRVTFYHRFDPKHGCKGSRSKLYREERKEYKG